jgi:NAD(P)-dependent dehydrogenase (short-subunit alcohol dehydrogenase family)
LKIKRYENKVALVTGGTSGIGKATAEAFATEGAQVIIAERRGNLGNEVINKIKDKGGGAIFIKTDIRNPAEIDRLFQTILTQYCRLDCAFNNAGISSASMKHTVNTTMEDWNWMINTNLNGVWLCMKQEIPLTLTRLSA